MTRAPILQTPARVAFLGLGVMGPMAGHLARAGHRTTVSQPHPPRRPPNGSPAAGSAATRRRRARGRRRDIVFCCVGNDDDLRSVVLGEDGAFAGMAPGAVFVDHTTASADVARELHAAAPRAACPSSTRRSPAAGRRRQRRADGDVRRRRAGLRDAMRPVAMAFARRHAPGRRAAPASSPRWSTRSPSPGWCRACRGDRLRRTPGLT